MVCLRLDELPELFEPYWLWSANSWNLAYFRRRDHLGKSDIPLDQAVRDLVEAQIGTRPQGAIQLMTHLCYFGFRFNPVSFYFCWSRDGQNLENIIAEINNTPWGEQHCYVFKVHEPIKGGTIPFTFKKEFHISPFMNMGMKYVWSFSKPGKDFHIHMESWEGDQKILDVSLGMTRAEISHTSLARVLFQYPSMTFKVVWGIYFQALRLWIKRCPFYPHPKYRKDVSLSIQRSGVE